MFFSFDGVDGVGKTTQIGLFCDWLRGQGREVVTCRDPGTSAIGEMLRAIVLESDRPIHRRTEMLIYMAARAQMVEEVIRPALEAGKVVVSDRYLLANIAYQAYGGGLDVEQVRSVGETAVAGVMPNLTFVLDMDPAESAQRRNRPPDRMEAQGVEFLTRVRRGFLTEAARDPGNLVVLDATQAIGAIQSQIQAAARRKLER